MSKHDFTYVDDFGDGWPRGECSCGWQSPPVPGIDEAVGFFTDHVSVLSPSQDTEH